MTNPPIKWCWDDLAAKDAIYAAVSATSEEQEYIKTIPQLKILLAELHEGIVLDAGCGYGRIAKWLLPERNFLCYIGVDLSLRMLQLFNKNRHHYSDRTPIMLLQAPVENLPLKDESVDNVFSIACFLHCPKTVVIDAIREVYRVLKPGGKFIGLVSFPNLFTLTGVQGSIYLLFLSLLGQSNRNGPVRYYSKYEVKQLFKAFREIKIVGTGFSMLPKSILGLPRSFNFYYRKLIWEKSQKLFDKLLPAKVKGLFCTHFDVIAIK